MFRNYHDLGGLAGERHCHPRATRQPCLHKSPECGGTTEPEPPPQPRNNGAFLVKYIILLKTINGNYIYIINYGHLEN